MALIPGTNVPSTITGTGTQSRGTQLLSGHIFNAGLEKPEILEALIIKYPQYYLTDLMEKIAGVSENISSDTFTWQIQDRTRKSATVTAISNGTTATATLTLDITADGSTDFGYFLPGDEFRVADTQTNGRVITVSNSGGFQTMTVQRYDGAAWATSSINTTNKIGHIGTGFARGSAGSGGTRSYLPTTDYSVTQIHRRGFTIERGVLHQKTYVDNKSWYFKNEDFEQKEFMRDFESKLLTANRFKTTTGVQQSRGLLDYAATSGQSVTFSSAIGAQESDWAQLIQQMYPQNGDNDLIALCGEKILLDTQHSLADKYRRLQMSEQPSTLAGLNFQSYEIAGKRIHFAYYEMFSDAAVFPVVTPSSTARDYRNLALVLDFGTVSGANERNIQVKYREGAKFIQKFIHGMEGPGLEAANAYDGLQGELLTEFGTACLLPNRLGLVYANS